MGANDEGWERTTSSRIKQNQHVKVVWKVQHLEFAAVGHVEEKPHRLDLADDGLRMKIGGRPGESRFLFIADKTGRCVTDSEAGFLWDGWLFFAKPTRPEFYRAVD